MNIGNGAKAADAPGGIALSQLFIEEIEKGLGGFHVQLPQAAFASQALAAAPITAKASTVPSASPFSKSPSLTAI